MLMACIGLNGAAPVDVKQPAAWEVKQPAPYSAAVREPRKRRYWSRVRRRFTIYRQNRPRPPQNTVVREITAVQHGGTPQEATTEEILGAMKPAPSMRAPAASETSSAEEEATTSEITGSHDTKFLQDLATARDVRDSGMVRTMRVDSAKVDVLLNQVGELVVNRSFVEQLSLDLKNLHRILHDYP